MPNLIKDFRLKKIYDMVSFSVVADIGADHGKISAKLLQDKKIDYAYITDISSKSLDKAKTLIKSLNLSDKAEFIVCDGFAGLENVDKPYQAIVAGMGGEEIIKIISNLKNKEKVHSLILQPQKNAIQLREFLISNGYKIVEDVVVKDKKQFYFVIKATAGQDILTKEQLYFGKTNLVEFSSDFVAYLLTEKQLYDNVISSANNISDTKRDYYDTLCKVINKGEILC